MLHVSNAYIIGNLLNSLEMDLNDESKWEIISTVPAERRANFWKAILLSVTKPHVINRRLAGAETISVLRFGATELNRAGKFMRNIAHIIQNHIEENDIGRDFMVKILQEAGVTDGSEEINTQCLPDIDLNEEKLILVILNKLLPKNLASHKCTFELTILGDCSRLDLFYANWIKNIEQDFIISR